MCRTKMDSEDLHSYKAQLQAITIKHISVCFWFLRATTWMGAVLQSPFQLTFSIFNAFICRIKSSTGRFVISGAENFSKSIKTAEEYNLVDQRCYLDS